MTIALATYLAGCVLVVGTERRVVGDAGADEGGLARCQDDCASAYASCTAHCQKGAQCKLCATTLQSCNDTCAQR